MAGRKAFVRSRMGEEMALATRPTTMSRAPAMPASSEEKA